MPRGGARRDPPVGRAAGVLTPEFPKLGAVSASPRRVGGFEVPPG